jgi:hypothetical protein
MIDRRRNEVCTEHWPAEARVLKRDCPRCHIEHIKQRIAELERRLKRDRI